jgi:hypothetical protein
MLERYLEDPAFRAARALNHRGDGKESPNIDQRSILRQCR